MITTDPKQQETLRQAEQFTILVQSTGWADFVRNAQAQRDRWLSSTVSNQDRDYLSAQANTVNILIQMPYDVLEKKEKIILELQDLEKQRKEQLAQQEENEPRTTRPSPQAT